LNSSVLGAVGAFDRAVEFGGARGKQEPMQSALLTGLLELGGELRIRQSNGFEPVPLSDISSPFLRRQEL
jgi:hypothetical protein